VLAVSDQEEGDVATDYRTANDMSRVRGTYDEDSAAGWLSFAVFMLTLVGVFNVIEGVVAVSKSKFFVSDAVYVFSDLNTWGWIVMGLGALQLLAAFTIYSGSQLARWFGIVAAGVNAIGQLLFVPAYPFWALSMFAVDLMIIYGLAVYAGPRLRER
jgi:hypothetical protein